MIPIWKEKIRYDAVRPLTAIRFIYGTKPVTSWGGPGKGTVENLPANEWRSYLGDADHPGMMFISNKSYLCILHVHYITLHYITSQSTYIGKHKENHELSDISFCCCIN